MRKGFLDKFVSRLDRIDAPVLSANISELAREHGLLETLFQSIDEGILVLDKRLTALYANRAAEKMVGFSLEDARTQSLARHLREWGIEGFFGSKPGAWEQVETREVELTYPEHRFIAYYVRPISVGEQPALLMMLRDVTREHRAEEEALADERLAAVKTLAAGVAHEIGNPLNALNIHLQLLERALKKVPEASMREQLQKLVAVAAAEVVRLDGIIRRFLTAIRPAKPTLMRGSVCAVLEATLRLLGPDLERRHITLQRAFPEAVPEIFLDGQQLEQVFFNLIRNAMDAVSDGGRIGLTITTDDAWVDVSILDNGAGIPPELLGRIFDPYVTTKAKGNGLGLMIVRRIVQAHGGTITCASHAGQGTCFTLRFPRAERRIRALGGGQREGSTP